MSDLENWLRLWQDAVLSAFGGQRVRFLGIQGSRARGEARPGSDIDAVLILVLKAQLVEDEHGVDVAAGARLAAAADALPEREKLCGFLGGWRELERWPRGELWQFCLDTRPVLGSLEPIAAQLTRGDIRESALTCAGAVYHGCVHARLHALDEAALGELMKTAFFALRAIHALKTGEALRTRAKLAGRLDGVERDIALGTLPGTAEERAAALFNWSAAALRSL